MNTNTDVLEDLLAILQELRESVPMSIQQRVRVEAAIGRAKSAGLQVNQ
jgi:hypothetical protein